jgi:hypothetical protein
MGFSCFDSNAARERGQSVEPAGKKIARFLKASNELEKYLHQDGPLTPLEHQTIETTILGLQTLLGSWTRKHRPETAPLIAPGVSPRKAQEP